MKRLIVLGLIHFLFIRFSYCQENKHFGTISLNSGFEKIVQFYPDYENQYYQKIGVFTIGLEESIIIKNFELFIGQYYSYERIPVAYTKNTFDIDKKNYSSSHLIFPLGIDVKVSKNKNTFLFLSGAYRLDFVFDQEYKEVSYITFKNPEFYLAKQGFESGLGINFKIMDALRLKFKTLYVFKPFYCEHLEIDDVTDSRIKLTIGVSTYF